MSEVFFKKVKFVGSFVEAPTRLELSQFAFCGRSNVGKSSLINALLGQKIAKVSKTPGKTITLNAYLVDEWFYLIDLPGYGYAKRSKQLQRQWQNFIENYLKNANMLRLIFVLVDAKIGPQRNDLDFISWLNYFKMPYFILLTKLDKATQSELSASKKAIESLTTSYLLTSSTQKKGIAFIADLIMQARDVSFKADLQP